MGLDLDLSAVVHDESGPKQPHAESVKELPTERTQSLDRSFDVSAKRAAKIETTAPGIVATGSINSRKAGRSNMLVKMMLR